MSKQAIVGLFTLVGLAAIFAVFFVITNFGAREGSYKVGVRFRTASGLRPGASVSLAGVPIGSVDSIDLKPDYSTEVVMDVEHQYDIPNGSRFLIQAPLTGEPVVLIQPPRDLASGAPTLPHQVLPYDQQPRGVNPTSISDLLEQGQGEIKRLDTILAQLEQAEPGLLAQLSSSIKNANALTQHADASLTNLSSHFDSIAATLQKTIDVSSGNVEELTGTLNQTAKRDSVQVDQLLAQLQQTSRSFAETVDSVKGIATNPSVKKNLLDTSRDFALTAHTFAELTGDLRNVTGNPQTQAQLRDTVAQIDATTQKVDSLVGQLGGKSNVYGVDPGATPGPVLTPTPPGYLPTSAPALPAAGSYATAAPVYPGRGTYSTAASAGVNANAGTEPSQTGLAKLKSRLDSFTKNLVALQVRVGVLAPLRPGSYDRNVQPLLTPDRGPQTDFNVLFLPKAATSLKVGVNDVGTGLTTANFLLVNHKGPLTYSGGLLYSRLGGTASVAGKVLGLEGRVYDLRHPTLDTYVNAFPLSKFQIFAGERDLTHAQRRSVFGVQAEF